MKRADARRPGLVLGVSCLSFGETLLVGQVDFHVDRKQKQTKIKRRDNTRHDGEGAPSEEVQSILNLTLHKFSTYFTASLSSQERATENEAFGILLDPLPLELPSSVSKYRWTTRDTSRKFTEVSSILLSSCRITNSFSGNVALHHRHEQSL